MEVVSQGRNVSEQPNSFGIKKIVDCKIGEDGVQMYKVKWEPTWEPAENLESCQHMIDEFWSFINKAKVKEEIAQQHRKEMQLKRGMGEVMNIDQKIHKMPDDKKSEIQRLISRAYATSVGSPMLTSPSDMLTESYLHGQQNNKIHTAQTSTHTYNQEFINSSLRSSQQRSSTGADGGGKQNLDSFGNKGNITLPSFKVNSDDSMNIDTTDSKETKTPSVSNASSLKYLENFSNPYVKVVIVCKICNKEASKNSGKWKIHFLTHASNEDKPHKCHICNQGFVQNIHLKRHMKKHMKTQELVPDIEIKHENSMQFKTEYSY